MRAPASISVVCAAGTCAADPRRTRSIAAWSAARTSGSTDAAASARCSAGTRIAWPVTWSKRSACSRSAVTPCVRTASTICTAAARASARAEAARGTAASMSAAVRRRPRRSIVRTWSALRDVGEVVEVADAAVVVPHDVGAVTVLDDKRPGVGSDAVQRLSALIEHVALRGGEDPERLGLGLRFTGVLAAVAAQQRLGLSPGRGRLGRVAQGRVRALGAALGVTGHQAPARFDDVV